LSSNLDQNQERKLASLRTQLEYYRTAIEDAKQSGNDYNLRVLRQDLHELKKEDGNI
jgi:hypothetical protein